VILIHGGIQQPADGFSVAEEDEVTDVGFEKGGSMSSGGLC